MHPVFREAMAELGEDGTPADLAEALEQRAEPRLATLGVEPEIAELMRLAVRSLAWQCAAQLTAGIEEPHGFLDLETEAILRDSDPTSPQGLVARAAAHCVPCRVLVPCSEPAGSAVWFAPPEA